MSFLVSPGRFFNVIDLPGRIFGSPNVATVRRPALKTADFTLLALAFHLMVAVRSLQEKVFGNATYFAPAPFAGSMAFPPGSRSRTGRTHQSG